jgi:hypothetical protein
MAGIGEPRRAGVDLIYRSPELSILNVIWGPGMTIMPHNHNMWAVIGLYTGREDNIFWRRLPARRNGEKIEAAGARSIGERQAAALGPDIIHSVTNPTGRLTGAIHVYGGDFVAAERSEWDPDTLCEGPYDMQKIKDIFEKSNRSFLNRAGPAEGRSPGRAAQPNNGAGHRSKARSGPRGVSDRSCHLENQISTTSGGSTG